MEQGWNDGLSEDFVWKRPNSPISESREAQWLLPDNALRLWSHVLAATAYKGGTVAVWKPWKIGKPGRITSESHLVTTKMNTRAVWKSLKPTLSTSSLSAAVYYGKITVSKVRGNRLNADPKPVTVPGIVDLFQTRPNLISSVVICWCLMLLRTLAAGERYIACLSCPWISKLNIPFRTGIIEFP